VVQGLYLHIPFCVAKCRYCDFTSYPQCSNEAKEKYLQALLQEAGLYAGLLRGSVPSGELLLDSLYFGGGTPTCLTGGQLFFLLKTLREIFPVRSDAEITVEGNPGTLDVEKLVMLCQAGFNRLSLGVQSFNDRELAVLGRIHTADEAVQAYRLAREAGFANISLDLMYGLPRQELEQWRASLSQALALKPEHISLYQLKIEEGTPFHQQLLEGNLQEFPDDQAAIFYEEAIQTLTEAGYHHYEISNFALPGRESRHNQLYWRNKEYLGLGVGAAGYLQGVRYNNETELAAYQAKLAQGLLPRADSEIIDKDLQIAEAIFLGLRLLEGIDKKEFFLHYGVKFEERFGKTITKLKSAGLLQEDERSIFLTKQGRNLANLVFIEFLP